MSWVRKIKYKISMRKHGKKCDRCGKKYLPNPHYAKLFPGWTHYPNSTHCGFCVYDMDSFEASQYSMMDDY